MELLESDKEEEKKTYQTPKITAVTFKVENCLTSLGGNNNDGGGDRGNGGQPGGFNINETGDGKTPEAFNYNIGRR